MKKLIVTSLLVALSLIFNADIYAQNTQIREFEEAELDVVFDDDGSIYWTSWNANWFVSFGLGYEKRFFPSKIEGFNLKSSPTYDIAVGKWIFPFIGLRLQYNWSDIAGTSTINNLFTDSDHVLHGGYATAHLDLIFDLTSIIKGYRSDRFYRILPYFGSGQAFPYGNNGKMYTKDYIAFGIVNKFLLFDRLSAKLEFRTSASNAGHFGIEETYQRERIYPLSITAGLSYAFTKNREYTQPDPKVVVKYVDKEVVREVVVRDTVKVENTIKELYLAGCVVKFELNSSKLSKIARVNLGYIAKAIKEIPSDKVFSIVGYCDVQTGSVAWNEGLSERRAKAVYNALVNEFGVDKSRLKIGHMGGVDLMFYEDNTLSRVVIIL